MPFFQWTAQNLKSLCETSKRSSYKGTRMAWRNSRTLLSSLWRLVEKIITSPWKNIFNTCTTATRKTNCELRTEWPVAKRTTWRFKAMFKKSSPISSQPEYRKRLCSSWRKQCRMLTIKMKARGLSWTIWPTTWWGRGGNSSRRFEVGITTRKRRSMAHLRSSRITVHSSTSNSLIRWCCIS